LIKLKSYNLVGGKTSSVDIVRDVLNYLPVHFVADHVVGLPLKSEDHPRGTFYEKELYEKLKDVYSYIFLDNDPTTKLYRQADVKDIVDNLAHLTGHHLSRIAGSWIPGIGVVDAAIHIILAQSTTSHEWLRRLYNTHKPALDLINDVVALAVIVSIELSQMLTHVVDAFLPPAEKTDTAGWERAKTISGLAKSSDVASIATLKGYILEALRLAPAIGGVYRTVSSDTAIEGVSYKRGDRVFVSIKDAQREAQAYGDTFSPPPEGKAAVPLLGDGLLKLMGQDWVLSVITPVVRTVFSLKNVKRADGYSGVLNSFSQTVDHIQSDTPVALRTYFDKNYLPGPWSSSLTIVFDE